LSTEGTAPPPPGAGEIGHVHLRGSPEAAWTALDEPESLCQALPGCDSVERDGTDGFRAVLSTRVTFITIRVDVTARYEEVDRPRHLRLVLDGSPRGLSGSFHVEIPVDLAPSADGGTDVSYSMAVAVEGALRGMAGPAIEQGLRREFAQALTQLDDRFAESAMPPAPNGSRDRNAQARSKAD
jgi:carbon monoxide dehydrogenase subunit G